MIVQVQQGNKPTIADAGVLIQSKRISKEGQRLRIEILSKYGPDKAYALLKLLDGDRRILANQPNSFHSEVRLKRGYWTPTNKAFKRVTEGLGGGSLYYGSCVFDVPEQCRRKAMFVGFGIGPADDSRIRMGETPDLYMERKSSKFGLSKTGDASGYGFVVNRTRIESQIEFLRQQFELNGAYSDNASDTLSELAFRIYDGSDSPLIWDLGC